MLTGCEEAAIEAFLRVSLNSQADIPCSASTINELKQFPERQYRSMLFNKTS